MGIELTHSHLNDNKDSDKLQNYNFSWVHQGADIANKGCFFLPSERWDTQTVSSKTEHQNNTLLSLE